LRKNSQKWEEGGPIPVQPSGPNRYKWCIGDRARLPRQPIADTYSVVKTDYNNHPGDMKLRRNVSALTNLQFQFRNLPSFY
jgi:hypothetical protein